MASDSMRERVARALCMSTGSFIEGHTPDTLVRCRDGSEIPRWRLFEDNASAAIDAMREPTEAMVEAGWVAGNLGWEPDVIKAVFTGMIGAALKEPPNGR